MKTRLKNKKEKQTLQAIAALGAAGFHSDTEWHQDRPGLFGAWKSWGRVSRVPRVGAQDADGSLELVGYARQIKRAGYARLLRDYYVWDE